MQIWIERGVDPNAAKKAAKAAAEAKKKAAFSKTPTKVYNKTKIDAKTTNSTVSSGNTELAKIPIVKQEGGKTTTVKLEGKAKLKSEVEAMKAAEIKA